MEPSKHAVVLDVDGNITPKEVPLLRAVDIGLPFEIKKHINDMWKRNIKRALAGESTLKEEREWIFASAEAYIESGLTTERYSQLLKVVQPRSGLRECLVDLHERGIPVALVSFGIADFINIFLRQHGLADHVKSVYALRLCHDKDGRVVGYKRASVVTPTDKGDWSEHFAETYGLARENLLAVGDSGADRYLGNLKINRFGIAKSKKEAKKLRKIMGKVVITESFTPAHQWLIRKIEETSQ